MSDGLQSNPVEQQEKPNDNVLTTPKDKTIDGQNIKAMFAAAMDKAQNMSPEETEKEYPWTSEYFAHLGRVHTLFSHFHLLEEF